MDFIYNFIKENHLEFLVQVFNIIITIIAAAILVKVVSKIIRVVVAKKVHNDDAIKANKIKTIETISISILKYVIWFIAAAIIIGELGFANAMNSMLAAAGIGGIALGIGAQSLISDIAVGFTMLFENQIAVGDYVQLFDSSGVTEGTVTDITLRTTYVQSFQGDITSIPNGKIAKIRNYSRDTFLAMVEIPVSAYSDTAHCLEIMKDIAIEYGKENELVTGEPEILRVEKIASGVAVLRMCLPVQPLAQWAIQGELNKRITQKFNQEGIDIQAVNVVKLNDK